MVAKLGNNDKEKIVYSQSLQEDDVGSGSCKHKLL